MNIYYCKHCKRICYTYPVDSTLVCCGDEMTLLQPKTMDQGNEKHLPVVERISENVISVKVGSVTHPMLPEHFIQWIFVEQGDSYQIKTFVPGEEPQATFNVKKDKPIKVFEFCNLHGLWMTELK
ncbi:MAG: desulfoferrodoxin family protein [Candidatus Izemoplasmatales bacterium]|jgi:superoxide reductase|nr:desulfoferrodoxin family protein [Candidatus Izemoplasmatales bacterium]